MELSRFIASRVAVAVVAGVVAIVGLTGGVAAWTMSASKNFAAAHGTIRVVDPCQLVTVKDAQVAFGGDPGSPHFLLGSCVYENANHKLIVSLANDHATQQFAANRTGAAETVEGLGDAAYSQGGRLAVLKGKSMMLITLVPGSATGVDPTELAMAHSIVTRL